MKKNLQSTYLRAPQSPPRNFRNIYAALGLILCSGLIFLIAILFSDYRQIKANQIVVSKAKNSQYSEIDANFYKYSNDSNFLNFFKSVFVKSPSSREKENIREDFHKVVEIIELIDKSKIKTLKKKYTSFNKTSASRLATSSKKGKAVQWILTQLDEISSEYFNKTEKWLEIKDSAPKRLKIIEDALVHADDNHTNKGQVELAELFSLENSIHLLRPGFYKSGVLKDLPILPSLPDNLSSLTELRNALNNIGGQVKIRGENAPERFKQILEKIKKTSQNEISTRAKLENEKENLKNQLNELRTYSKKGAKNFKLLLYQLSIQSIQSELSWLGKRVFVS